MKLVWFQFNLVVQLNLFCTSCMENIQSTVHSTELNCSSTLFGTDLHICMCKHLINPSLSFKVKKCSRSEIKKKESKKHVVVNSYWPGESRPWGHFKSRATSEAKNISWGQIKTPDVVLSNDNAERMTEDITWDDTQTFWNSENQTHFLILHTAMSAFSAMQRQEYQRPLSWDM